MSAETAAEIDRDEGRDIGDSKAVARNELMSVQFVIHSFRGVEKRPLAAPRHIPGTA